MAFYEVTRACDLVCRHCRACAQPLACEDELSHEQSLALLDDLAGFEQPPQVILTGGDPMRRSDLPELVRHAAGVGLRPAVALSATPRVTRDRLRELAEAGMSALAVSLDGADEETHRRLRGIPGTFDRAIRILRDADALGVATQVNTTVTRDNVGQIDAMAEMLDNLGIRRWSVFFLVPTGRGSVLERIEPMQYRDVFERLHEQSKMRSFMIKTTEAPFYRRFVIQRDGEGPRGGKNTLGVNDGRGVVFISHVGEIQPSGFLPLTRGRFPADSVVRVYHEDEVFGALQDPDRLGGKCGVCDFRRVCGGSRARAFALTGDYLAEEPDCGYRPPLAVTPGLQE
ncbi:radical SAM protein [Mucisphaera calidilacus]|uniref:Antilisterial bacteriocin subtilosin biosynthesis protein AlbA n=1 Tax=Mucisphaera calidilacus TaxID=2527982 RepID=A0A518BZD0_9BACT|nr:radical SAM protein [Mucisphaera calidilacus]QDU72332.1 Antilisterial bacteriocin subtilosin biosynthesis protein AlbA [Mucisphaera calidilacus]